MNVMETIRAGFRARDVRIPVHVRARMRVADRWADITIHNVSTRGLMARSAGTPAPGSYVEIRRGTEVEIIGRVVWRKGPSFGLRAQDPIDIATLIGQAGDRRDDPHDPAVERRAAPRRSPDEILARSQRFAQCFQFVALGAAGVVAAGLIGKAVFHALDTPLAVVANHL